MSKVVTPFRPRKREASHCIYNIGKSRLMHNISCVFFGGNYFFDRRNLLYITLDRRNPPTQTFLESILHYYMWIPSILHFCFFWSSAYSTLLHMDCVVCHVAIMFVVCRRIPPVLSNVKVIPPFKSCNPL